MTMATRVERSCTKNLILTLCNNSTLTDPNYFSYRNPYPQPHHEAEHKKDLVDLFSTTVSNLDLLR